MISLKEDRNGRIHYIFENEYAEQAKQAFPFVSAKMLGVQMAIESPEQVVKERTLDDVANSVEGCKFTTLKLNKIVPKTTINTPTDTAELRNDIRGLIYDLCAKDGLKVGRAWLKAYRLLAGATGFDVYKVTPTRVSGHVSLIQTIFDYNMAEKLSETLRRYLDK